MPLTSGITNKTYTITYRSRWVMVGGLLAQLSPKRNGAWWEAKMDFLATLQAKNYVALSATMVASVTRPAARAFSKIGEQKPLHLYRENARATLQGVLTTGGTFAQAEALITDTIRGYDVAAGVGKQSLFMYLRDTSASVNTTHFNVNFSILTQPLGGSTASIPIVL